VPQGNQAGYLEGQCFLVPLRSYQVLGGGTVLDNVHPTNDLVDCVSFGTTLGGGVSGVLSAGRDKPVEGEKPASQAPVYTPPPTRAPKYESPATTKSTKYESPATTKSPKYESPATTKPPSYESPASTKPPKYESPVTTKPPKYESPASTKPPKYESPAATKPPSYDHPATTKPPKYESPATTKPASYDYPATTKPASYDYPATTKPASYDYPATTKPASYDYPATTKPASYQAPTAQAPSYNSTSAPATTGGYAPTASQYSPPAGSTKPTSMLPDITCDANGCPAPSVVAPIFQKCGAQLAGRDPLDVWVFAAAGGQSSEGKTCGTADTSGKQLCTGTLKNVQFCDAGFACDANTYRPQLVQCVSETGEICKLSSLQLKDVILEKVENGSNFFVSCKQ
jgi:hypothetical protein